LIAEIALPQLFRDTDELIGKRAQIDACWQRFFVAVCGRRFCSTLNGLDRGRVQVTGGSRRFICLVPVARAATGSL
jgi:hypothetical protein